MSGLKLTFRPYPLTLRHTFTVATCSRTSTPGVQVSLSAQGQTGYGEASMPPYLGETVESVTDFLSSLDLTQFTDPLRTADILDYTDRMATGHNAAKAAVDIALHDLQGRLLGQPLWRLWGLSPEATRRIPTTYTIGIDTPAVMQAKAREAEGRFARLKIKVGTDHDRQLIEALREVTDLPLTVDANQGWQDPSMALRQIEWMAEHGVIMVEQPLPRHDLKGLAWLTRRSPLPIYADESCRQIDDVRRMAGVVSGINIKLMKCGGLREARRMICVARALGLKVMLGCMTETSCAIAAAAQLLPMADCADLDGNLLISNDPFEGGPALTGGCLTLSHRPGLGITLRASSMVPCP